MIQFRFTPLGRFFLLLMLLFYAASITSQSGLLLLFIGLLAGMVLLNFVVAGRTVKHLQVQAPKEVLLAEGQKLTEPWRITNPLARALHLFYLDSPAGRLLKIAAIGEQETIAKVPDLQFNKRGVFPNSKIRVGCVAPVGLVEAFKNIEIPGEVVVYPAIYVTEVPMASALDNLTGGKFKGNRRTTSGSNFAGVRPWAAGDPIKQIHWKSSAKRRQLMVKTFEEELSGRISILLDCNGAESETLAENAIRAAGSLVFAALEMGHCVELCVLPEKSPLLVPPFADGTEALLHLAKVEVQATSTKVSSLETALEKVSRKSAIVYIGTAFTEAKMEWINGLQAHGRKVSVYLPREIAGTDAGLHVPLFYFGEKEIVEALPSHIMALPA
jgi:uncharacterized protein (DUF58 family)